MKTLSLGLTYRDEMDTKRAQKIGGVIGDPVTHLTGVRCSYPIVIDPSGLTGLRESEVIQTLTEVYWIFVDGYGLDIEVGDTVTVNDQDYIIRIVHPRPAPSVLSAGSFTRLTVEKLII